MLLDHFWSFLPEIHKDFTSWLNRPSWWHNFKHHERTIPPTSFHIHEKWFPIAQTVFEMLTPKTDISCVPLPQPKAKLLMRKYRLYTAGTPNGQKISITLEELGIKYEITHVDISKSTQKGDWYLKINRRLSPFIPPLESPDAMSCSKWPHPRNHRPNTKSRGKDPREAGIRRASHNALPVSKIRWRFQDLISVWHREVRRLPSLAMPVFNTGSGSRYWEVMEWMTWMQSGIGPMQGQANHFFRYAPQKIEYAIQRYQTEVCLPALLSLRAWRGAILF
jgi:hypothetical protein